MRDVAMKYCSKRLLLLISMLSIVSPIMPMAAEYNALVGKDNNLELCMRRRSRRSAPRRSFRSRPSSRRPSRYRPYVYPHRRYHRSHAFRGPWMSLYVTYPLYWGSFNILRKYYWDDEWAFLHAKIRAYERMLQQERIDDAEKELERIYHEIVHYEIKKLQKDIHRVLDRDIDDREREDSIKELARKTKERIDFHIRRFKSKDARAVSLSVLREADDAIDRMVERTILR